MHAKYSSPSNIALVKYWGKKENQIPSNASISFTLSEAKTITTVELSERKTQDWQLDFRFEGSKNHAFESRIKKYLDSIEDQVGWIGDYDVQIESENTFPHSSGIASSASAMSALAMCIVDIECQLSGESFDNEQLRFASNLSRIGSGSACRSVYPLAAVWGQLKELEATSNEYAIGVEGILHEQFRSYRNSILIVSDEEKAVSSSVGHELMNANAYSKTRFELANINTAKMIDILKVGDLDSFVDLVEFEALNLHALMMVSNPSYILLKPNTLEVLSRVRQYRKESSIPVCFTLDAGPNVHLLYPEHYESEVKNFIQTDLLEFCHAERLIHDFLGQGSCKLD